MAASPPQTPPLKRRGLQCPLPVTTGHSLFFVIPANAGTQSARRLAHPWVPAFAGMTKGISGSLRPQASLTCPRLFLYRSQPAPPIPHASPPPPPPLPPLPPPSVPPLFFLVFSF